MSTPYSFLCNTIQKKEEGKYKQPPTAFYRLLRETHVSHFIKHNDEDVDFLMTGKFDEFFLLLYVNPYEKKKE